nr:PDZ domain-containing protein [Pluralibacter gergoviae]
MPNSSAAKAGIKAGDVITTLNGKAISSFAALRAQSVQCRWAAKLSWACCATASR